MAGYESLMRRIFPGLYEAAFEALGDEEAAAMAAQHAFLAAYAATGRRPRS